MTGEKITGHSQIFGRSAALTPDLRLSKHLLLVGIVDEFRAIDSLEGRFSQDLITALTQRAKYQCIRLLDCTSPTISVEEWDDISSAAKRSVSTRILPR